MSHKGLWNTMFCDLELCERCKRRGTSWSGAMCNLPICDDCTMLVEDDYWGARYICIMPSCDTEIFSVKGDRCLTPTMTVVQYEDDSLHEMHGLLVFGGDTMIKLRKWSTEQSLTNKGIVRDHYRDLGTCNWYSEKVEPS